MPKDDISGLFDKAEEHLLQKAVRRSEPTITDGLLTPAPESAPGAPKKATVPRPRPKAPPVALPEAQPKALPEAPPSSGEQAVFDAREAPTKQLPGRKRRPVPVVEDSVYPPVVSGVPSTEMDAVIFRQATRLSWGRMLLLIAAAGTAVSGIIAATGNAVVSIITAMRPPANIEVAKRLDGMETRLNGDFGLKLETETRQKKDEELKQEIDKIARAQKKLEDKLVVKVKPGR